MCVCVLGSTCVDPASDWSAPCEEWGNYEDQPAEGTVSARAPPAELQVSLSFRWISCCFLKEEMKVYVGCHERGF